VRTPGEFDAGHIPGAVNLPLFSDEERAEVGRLYKQANPESAFLKGLEYAGQKMRWYVEHARKVAPAKSILVHCWRGGQRSASIGWLLESAGFDCKILEGGYKSYRTYYREEFVEKKFRLVLLGGKTGSGKTALLSELASMGEQVVDLEKLANHKGSAFGMLGEEAQPSCEQFENDLHDELEKCDPIRRIWIENESRSIGKVFIPDKLFAKFRKSPMVMVEQSFENRVARLVEVYGRFQTEDLIISFEKIQKRLGGQHVKEAIESIKRGDLSKACRIALTYYDKAYDRSTKMNGYSSCEVVIGEGITDVEMAEKVLATANNNGI
jgi:tRNA 2-selenouridine synthase